MRARETEQGELSQSITIKIFLFFPLADDCSFKQSALLRTIYSTLLFLLRILIILNMQIYGWTPDPYLEGDDIPTEIAGRHSEEYIGISCEGKVCIL